MAAAPLWDIFCRVIDNHGDIGVCWRLAADLAARAQRVRLWVDHAAALQWLAPQGHEGVQVLPWRSPLPPVVPGDVVIEAFACELDVAWITAMAGRARAPVWINLEYLSAEAFVERNHGLPSPQPCGLVKYFFYPGFTQGTGGLLREADLAQRQAGFERGSWLASQGIAWHGEDLISLFCYEPPALDSLLDQLASRARPSRLLVTCGRAHEAVARALARRAADQPTPALSYLPALTQIDYDHLLWACDLNFVRGEDSLARALWAGKPLVWNIYPQHDHAHEAKLEAFLALLRPPAALARFHRVWNALAPGDLPVLPIEDWQASICRLRERLMALPDLSTRLLEFVRKTG